MSYVKDPTTLAISGISSAGRTNYKRKNLRLQELALDLMSGKMTYKSSLHASLAICLGSNRFFEDSSGQSLAPDRVTI